MAANNDSNNPPSQGIRPRRRQRRPMNRREEPGGPTRVELRIDTLILPHGHDGQNVRQAVEAALYAGLAQRLANGSATPANRRTVARALPDPLPAEASGIGDQLAAEVIRAVLP